MDFLASDLISFYKILTIIRMITAYDSLEQNPNFWLLYLSFEVDLLEKKEQEVGPQSPLKALFFRSLRGCPWSKDLYLFGFQHRSLIFSRSGIQGHEEADEQEELESLVALMQDKEIRCRVSLWWIYIPLTLYFGSCFAMKKTKWTCNINLFQSNALVVKMSRDLGRSLGGN